MDGARTGEVWKQIQGYPRYEISNHGAVKRDGFPHQTYPTKGGYPTVCLTQNKKSTSRAVHRLVLETFGEAQPTKWHVCGHRDGNPANNKIENLRWVTAEENALDRRKHDLIAKHGIEEYARVHGERPPHDPSRKPPKKVRIAKTRKAAMIWRNPFGELPPTEAERNPELYEVQP